MERLTILLFILMFTLVAYLFMNNRTEHLTSESNEALQTLSSLYTNQGTLVVPNLKVTGNITAADLTLTGSNTDSCGAKNICMSVAPEYRGNYGLNVSGNIQAEDIISAKYANIGSGIAVENTGYMGTYANGGGGQGNITATGNIAASGNVNGNNVNGNTVNALYGVSVNDVGWMGVVNGNGNPNGILIIGNYKTSGGSTWP